MFSSKITVDTVAGLQMNTLGDGAFHTATWLAVLVGVIERTFDRSPSRSHSQRNYAKALDLLFAFAAGRPLTRALLLEFRATMDGLAPSTVNVRLSAIRKLVSEARRNGMLSAEDAPDLTDIPTSARRGPVWETG